MLAGTVYGDFMWGNLYPSALQQQASGSFSFTVDPNNTVTGSGQGHLYEIVSNSQCQGSGDTAYTFSVTGLYSPSTNQLSLGFLIPNPKSDLFTETCSYGGPPVTSQSNDLYSSVEPSGVDMQAVDGSMYQCSVNCGGVGVTFKITLSATPITVTLSTMSVTSETTTATSSVTSSGTSTSTSSEISSATSGTTLTISTSNSTSTSNG